ncbi:UDP-N-acetylglucosamine 2-epimerase [Alphaproteobacteria bacterium]|nr:UDP-N-acetylglucosamine 2-epimerase [Alphaproteobacteria bacterium]
MSQHPKLAKIICVTSGRSDMFIWLPVWRALAACKNFDILIAKTGMHCATETLNYDGELADFDVVEFGFDLGGGTPHQAAKAMGKNVSAFGQLLMDHHPDAIFVLGDRMDMLPAVVASLPFNIRVIHLHGGEVSLGAVDDRIRHAVSMMSSLHFVAHDNAKTFLENLKIDQQNIHVVGAPGLDNIMTVPVLSRDVVIEQLGLKTVKDFFVGTIHSETNSKEPLLTITQTIAAIKSMDEYTFIFTSSNSDPYGSIINKILRETDEELENFHFLEALNYQQYVNLMRHSVAVIGNSSSGLIEAPFLGVRTLNIGERQRGRLADKHVVHCLNDSDHIKAALNNLFINRHETGNAASTLYGNGNAADKIQTILESCFK